ncbi:peptidylprolyl isomerase [Streptomyces sp. NPDC033753]|uniref:peptidylprolyl isomerase n=1 Tax=Streptomyces sp. NPDC033753 TaxID=3155128 RepID=UPI0033F6EF24
MKGLEVGVPPTTHDGSDARPGQQGWGYAVFGRVIEGTEVVDAIATVSTDSKAGHQDVPKDDVIVERPCRSAACGTADGRVRPEVVRRRECGGRGGRPRRGGEAARGSCRRRGSWAGTAGARRTCCRPGLPDVNRSVRAGELPGDPRGAEAYLPLGLSIEERPVGSVEDRFVDVVGSVPVAVHWDGGHRPAAARVTAGRPGVGDRERVRPRGARRMAQRVVPPPGRVESSRTVKPKCS